MPTKGSASASTKEVAVLLNDKFARLARQLRNLDLPAGMTPERLSAMAAIDSQGPISVTALADREMVRPATMSRMVSALVDDGAFRQDLYFRLNGTTLSIPPLRRRRADIPFLAQHFAEEFDPVAEDAVECLHPASRFLMRAMASMPSSGEEATGMMLKSRQPAST